MLIEKKLIKKIYGMDNYNPCVKEVILKDGEKLSNYLTVVHDLIMEDGVKLMIAPTGCGKTYTIQKIMNMYSVAKIAPDTIFVIICPNKVQNSQNEADYNLQAFISGTKYIMSDKISAVFEKTDEILKDAKRNNKKIITILDEAHLILESYGYRSNGINKVKELMLNSEKTLLMTATPDILLKFIPFTKILNVKFDNYVNNTKIVIDSVDSADSYLDNLLIENKNKNMFIRINNKTKLKKVVNTIGLNDSNYMYSGAETKLYKELTGENKKKGEKSGILKNGIYISTPLIDCGTNITSYPKDLVAYSVNYFYGSFSLSSLKQFLSRFRNNINEYHITINNKNLPVKDINDIYVEINDKVNKCLESFKHFLIAIKPLCKTQDDLLGQVDYFLKGNINNVSNNMGCIYFDKDTMEFKIDNFALYHIIYEKWQSQFYFAAGELIKYIKNNYQMYNVVFRQLDYTTENEKNKEEDNENTDKNKALDSLKKILNPQHEDNKFFRYLIQHVDEFDYKLLKESKTEDLMNIIKCKKIFKNYVLLNKLKINDDIILNTIGSQAKMNNIMIINNNNLYKKGITLPGANGIFQTLIIESVKVKSTLSDKNLKKATDYINSKSDKQYTVRQVKNLIKKVYNVDKTNRITSLK